jgi:multidrug efflux pump subunit AcrB
MISAIFVDRPRLAVVVALIITLAGLLALTRIPVAQFPDIVPPQVQVTANYPGASAAVVEASIAQPIEAQVVGVDKMIYMKSTSGNDGSYTLTVSFLLGSDPDIDTVNVNNRVQTALAPTSPSSSTAGPDSPEEVVSDLAVHLSLQRERQPGPALHRQLRDYQCSRRIVAHSGRRSGCAVRAAQLLDAHLVRYPASG